MPGILGYPTTPKPGFFYWDISCLIQCFRAFGRFVSFKTVRLRRRLISTTGHKLRTGISKENTNMKDTKKIFWTVLRVIVALVAIACIILSMYLDETMPFLPIGLGLTAIANVINCCKIRKMRGNNNGSTENRCVS